MAAAGGSVYSATMFGWRPYREMERVAVIGYGDRHYLAMTVAQETWTDYLGELFVNALAGEGAEEQGAQIIDPVRTQIEASAA